MHKIIPADSVLVPDAATLAFQGEIFATYQWEQELFDGTTAVFEMLKRTDTVTAICIVDDHIVVIDDEQPHTGSRKTFPGGRVDSTDQSTEQAVQREVLEETGYSFKNWRLIKVSQPYKKMEWFTYIYLAWEVTAQQAPHLDAGEKITVNKLSFDETKQLVITKDGHLGDSVAIIESVETLAQLLLLPEFDGRSITR